MKLLRHLLSHTFLILFIVILVSAYYYRSLLLAPDINQKIDAYVSELYAPAVAFTSGRDYFWAQKNTRSFVVADLVVNNEVPPVPEAEQLAAESERSETNNNHKAIAVQANDVPAAIDVVPEQNNEATNDEQQAQQAEKLHTNVVLPSVNSVDVVADAAADVIQTTDIQTQARAENTTGTTPYIQPESESGEPALNTPESESDILINARNAFNFGNLALSEQYYQQLTARQSANPDVFGELGNVYYAQGKWQQAGQAYYEAASRLIQQGRHEQVAYLQRVIQGLDAASAEKLTTRIHNNN